MKTITTLLLLLCLGASVPPPLVSSRKASSATVMPSVVTVYGTNAAVQNGQFTNVMGAATTLALIAMDEFNGAITGIFLTNQATHVGDGAATLLTRTNGSSTIDTFSLWYLVNPPTGSVETTWTSGGNRFPTFLVAGIKGNNATPFNSNITLDFEIVAAPGITNTIGSSANELVIGLANASELGDSASRGFTNTISGQATAGAYVVAGGGTGDIQCVTNAGSATVTVGYSSAAMVQGLIIISVKP